MSTSIRRNGLLWLAVFAIAAPGCASSSPRVLHATGGDHFTLFAEPERPLPPMCAGEATARFACVAARATAKAGEGELSGTLVYLDAGGPRTFAAADRSQSAPMSEQSRFPIGSMTKMFTALTVLALASSGQIDLHAPIARYLPELSDSTGPGQVTLDQLLSHTSGLTPKAELCARADEDISDVVRKYAAQPLWAPPGAVYNYSNLNYVFAGAVLERESGARFEQLVLDRVLVPLGLSEASFEPEAVRGRGLVKGDAAPILPRCRAMWPAGGLALTAAELGHFLDLVSKPERFPLGERLLDDLTAPRTATGMRDGEHYGYGISRFRAGGVEFFNHGGRLPGYASFIAWTPARRAGAAALANRHSSWPLAAVAQTLSAMLALPLRAFLPQPSPSHPLDQYVGTYVDRIGGLGVVRIRRDGSSLVMDYPRGAPSLLPVTFRFVFVEGASAPRYVVTDVGVGELVPAAARDTGAPPRT